MSITSPSPSISHHISQLKNSNINNIDFILKLQRKTAFGKVETLVVNQTIFMQDSFVQYKKIREIYPSLLQKEEKH